LRQILVKLAPFIAVVTVLAGCGPGLLTSPSPTVTSSPLPPLTITLSGVQAGEKGPDFSLPDLDGNIVNLSQYRGRPVFLNFWSPT
jgi:cytochrome oxidase Cu insertion factor (SCO1/SenC/PrrC family)